MKIYNNDFTEFPGSKQVCEASTKFGPTLVSGPVFFVFEKVSTFIVTEDKEAETTTTVTVEETSKEVVIEEEKEKVKEKEEEKAPEEAVDKVEATPEATPSEPPKVEEEAPKP